MSSNEIYSPRFLNFRGRRINYNESVESLTRSRRSLIS